MALETFKSFYSEEEALSMFDLLAENGIEGKIQKTREILDKVIVGDGMDAGIHLKIQPGDFNRANEIINRYIQQRIESIPPDYYLYNFSNDELNEIIAQPYEWSNQDYIIARKILTDKGEIITDAKLTELKSSSYQQIKQPEKIDSFSLVVGYLCAIFGLLGLFYGLVVYTSKRVLPDGQKIYRFDEKARNHGLIIIVISCVVLAILAIALVKQLFA